MTKYTILIALLFVGCKAPQYALGMSEQEFLASNNVNVLEQTRKMSVYSKTNYPFGGPAVTKFFYFYNGTLIEVNQGERSPDVIFENRER